MKHHTKIYFDYFKTDTPLCEIPECGKLAVDIHHIKNRGMGGSKTKDNIENLMALCREHHLEFGDRKQYTNFLILTHLKNL